MFFARLSRKTKKAKVPTCLLRLQVTWMKSAKMISAVQVIVDLQEKTHTPLLMKRTETASLNRFRQQEQERDHKATFLDNFVSKNTFI